MKARIIKDGNNKFVVDFCFAHSGKAPCEWLWERLVDITCGFRFEQDADRRFVESIYREGYALPRVFKRTLVRHGKSINLRTARTSYGNDFLSEVLEYSACRFDSYLEAEDAIRNFAEDNKNSSLIATDEDLQDTYDVVCRDGAVMLSKC